MIGLVVNHHLKWKAVNKQTPVYLKRALAPAFSACLHQPTQRMSPFSLSLVFATALISLVSAVNPNCPEGMHARQEFRDMSRYEWLNFKAALDHLYSTTIDGSESFIDRFTRVQLENIDTAHKYTCFAIPL